MERTSSVKLGEQFRPSPQLKSLYRTYFTLILVVAIPPWFIPLLVKAPPSAVLGALIPVIVVPSIVLYWIPRFYETISYVLNESEVVWRRGVWFKNTGVVPYNRITNVDIVQGPVSRRLGTGALKIQTAGYSANKSSAEIRLEGIEDFEELRETIMDMVRGKPPQAVETYDRGKDLSAEILDEVRNIRKLIETQIQRSGD